VDILANLSTESVDQLGQQPPLCVAPETTIRQVLLLLKEHGAGSALVCREEVLEGIFTERNALRLMAQQHDLDAPIAGVMVRDPVAVRADETLAKAIRKMSAGGYRRLPIVDGHRRVVGKVNVSGIVHWLVEHFPKAVYNLPPAEHAVVQDRDGG
jgi:CBS domain-containing protein